MDGIPDTLLRMAVEIPSEGKRTVIRKGAMELWLENHHGGLSVLTQPPPAAGSTSTEPPTPAERPPRHFLGLAGPGRLELGVRAPEHRVRVHLVDRLTLVPGGRLRGYVAVPLPHRLHWIRRDGRRDALLDVAPRELRTAWLGEGPEGGYVHEARSGFYLDRNEFPFTPTAALVPVVILNQTEHVLSPEHLTVRLRDRDLRQVEGRLVAAPRRLLYGGSKIADERIRSLPRRSA